MGSKQEVWYLDLDLGDRDEWRDAGTITHEVVAEGSLTIGVGGITFRMGDVPDITVWVPWHRVLMIHTEDGV